jgi:hypothetical protein
MISFAGVHRPWPCGTFPFQGFNFDRQAEAAAARSSQDAGPAGAGVFEGPPPGRFARRGPQEKTFPASDSISVYQIE